MKTRRHFMVAAIIIVIAATIFLSRNTGWRLTLRDGDTGEVYARYALDDNDQFAVGFVHSVNKNPVIDVYSIQDHIIYVEQTIYYSFGAGVQTQLNPGETLDYGEDGSMIISNIHQPFDPVPLRYLVGSVSDHTLLLGDITPYSGLLKDIVGQFYIPNPSGYAGLEVISLSELCGRKTKVVFTCEFGLYL